MPRARAPPCGAAIRPILAPGTHPLFPVPEMLLVAVLIVDFPQTNLEALEELALLSELARDRIMVFVGAWELVLFVVVFGVWGGDDTAGVVEGALVEVTKH